MGCAQNDDDDSSLNILKLDIGRVILSSSALASVEVRLVEAARAVCLHVHPVAYPVF